MSWFTRTKRIYLDHAAATPLSSVAQNAMRPYLRGTFGNASAIHTEGRAARTAVDDARLSVARTLGVRPDDVTFTSGGTEGNNLALRGHVTALQASGLEPTDIEIVATKTEHPSVAETLTMLESNGCTVRYVPVGADGRVSVADLEAVLSEKTRLVTIAYANSETGVVQDLPRLARSIERVAKRFGTRIVLHTDACQAPLWLSCEIPHLRVDLMTLDAAKFGGPKSVGVLVHRRVALAPLFGGGGQEGGLRPGTENVAGIVGCAAALAEAQRGYEARAESVRRVRDHGIETLLRIPGAVLNGSREHRLANNINISIPGLDTEYAVVVLDEHGIAASTKSACSGAGSGRSRIVYEMTGDEQCANATLRLTLGPETTGRDIEKTATMLQVHVDKMSLFKAVK